jgi:predicted DsbA family dithiol-disulfide isomerase
MAQSTKQMAVTVYSDVICPWCYVGKRRFEAALDVLGLGPRVAISWRPFELNPTMPEMGISRADYRTRKFGAERAADLDRQMLATGRDVNIPFAFDRMLRTPNTRLAHRLIWQAGENSIVVQNRLVELLFRAYFEDALDIGDSEVLRRIAYDVGLASDQIRIALGEQKSLDTVVQLEAEGVQMGIQGVPYFILIDKYVLSGAQPTEIWQKALPQILAEATAS